MLFLLRSCNLLGSIVVIPAAGLGLPDRAVVAGELHVLVLPGELEPQRPAELALHPVGHVDAAGARQELHPVRRPRVHHEVEGVHPLGPRLGGRAVDWLQPVQFDRQKVLCKQKL